MSNATAVRTASAFCLLSAVLAGCMAPGPSVTIPVPGAGAFAVYESDGGKRFRLQIGTEAGENEISTLDDASGATDHRALVNATTGRIIREEFACGVPTAEGNCLGNLARISTQTIGNPWGYGASLFFGRTLHENDEWANSFHVGHQTIETTYKVTRVARDEGGQAQITGTASATSYHSPFHGRWTVQDGVPFPTAYEATISIRVEPESPPFSAAIKLRLVEWDRGTGSPVAAIEGDPPSVVAHSKASSFARLPAGFDEPIGWNGLNLAAAWERLEPMLDTQSEVAQDPAYQLLKVQVPKGGGQVRMPAHQTDIVEIQFKIVASDGRVEEWIVPYRCSETVDRRLFGSCQYDPPTLASNTTATRGAVGDHDAIPLHVAQDLARPLMHGDLDIFVFKMVLTDVGPSVREESYQYLFLSSAGEVQSNLHQGVGPQVDAFSGQILTHYRRGT